MSATEALNDIVRSLFAAQPLGILATQGNEYPYCTIVAFTPSDDLRRLLIATPRGTSKYNNIPLPGTCDSIDC